jgi:hypothetical protein
MTLKECLAEIITKRFTSGKYFDSHTIFTLLFDNNTYHLAYLDAFKEGHYQDVNVFHSHIAKWIEETGLVENTGKEIITLTLHGELQPSRIWKKL